MRFSAVQFTAALLFALPGATFAKPTPINGLAATVNNRIITKSELNESMKFQKQAIARHPSPAERSKMLNSLKKDTLESLIDREVVLSEFDKRGGQVRPDMVDDDIKTIIREDFGGDRKKFLAELKKQGTTIEKFRELREKMIAVRFMRSSQIKDIPIAAPGDIKKFYDDNPELFRAEGHIRLRTITLPQAGDDGDLDAQRKLANEILDQLKGGADFGNMAKAYSIDSASADGGDRGTIGRNTDALRGDLVQVAFAQKTGVVSKLIEDQAFFYIMKVESRKPGARTPLSDPKVRDAIEKRLQAEKRKAALDRWIERLKKDAIIKRF